MKKYFIHIQTDENYSSGKLTNNLKSDFIDKYKITWHEEYEDGDDVGLNPIIEDVRYAGNYDEIFIFELDDKKDRQLLIGHFKLWMDCYDELLDFIEEYHRQIEFPIDDEPIKKFKEF